MMRIKSAEQTGNKTAPIWSSLAWAFSFLFPFSTSTTYEKWKIVIWGRHIFSDFARRSAGPFDIRFLFASRTAVETDDAFLLWPLPRFSYRSLAKRPTINRKVEYAMTAKIARDGTCTSRDDSCVSVFPLCLDSRRVFFSVIRNVFIDDESQLSVNKAFVFVDAGKGGRNRADGYEWNNNTHLFLLHSLATPFPCDVCSQRRDAEQ